MCLLSFDSDTIPNVRLLGHVNYSTPWKHFTRTINEYVLYFVKSGELYIKEGNSQYTLRKGDLLFLEPNIEHQGFKEACCHYFYIHFKHNGITNVINKSYEDISEELTLKRRLSLMSDIFSEEIPIDSIFYIPKSFHCKNDEEFFSILSDAHYDFHQRLENYKKITSLRFAEFLIQISRQFTTSKLEKSINQFSKSFIKVRDIINYFDNNYCNKISSDEIEQLCESNFDYLNRVFNKMTGYTIFNYLNLLRIKKAKDLIVSTSLKYSEIGYLVGIEDPYYFSKLFKKYTGLTASQFAKNNFR